MKKYKGYIEDGKSIYLVSDQVDIYLANEVEKEREKWIKANNDMARLNADLQKKMAQFQKALKWCCYMFHKCDDKYGHLLEASDGKKECKKKTSREA